MNETYYQSQLHALGTLFCHLSSSYLSLVYFSPNLTKSIWKYIDVHITYVIHFACIHDIHIDIALLHICLQISWLIVQSIQKYNSCLSKLLSHAKLFFWEQPRETLYFVFILGVLSGFGYMIFDLKL